MDSRQADSNMSLLDSDKPDTPVNGGSKVLSNNGGAGDKKSGNGESHGDDNTSIGADHHLDPTIQGLVNKVKNAHNAFSTGGYDAKGKHWTELLPDQAEVLLPRYIDPYGETAGDMERVAIWLREMGQGWMLSINGERPGNDSATARHNDTAVSNATSQAPSAQ